MTPDLPNNPRSELEARLTALLLGELPADEAAALRERIAQDPELARLYAQLEHTIELVRETAATPADQTADQPAPLRLSGDRREKLLARFKTVAPKEFAKERKRYVSWALQAVAAVAVLLLIVSISIPNFVRSRTTSQSNAIINTLRQIDGAKQQWALEHNKSAADRPTLEDLAPYLRGQPSSIAGESYQLGSVGEPVSAEWEREQSKSLFTRFAGKPAREKSVGKQITLSAEGAVTTTTDQTHERATPEVALLSLNPQRGTPWQTITVKPPPAGSTITFANSAGKPAAKPDSETRDREKIRGDNLADRSSGNIANLNIVLPSSTELAEHSPAPTSAFALDGWNGADPRESRKGSGRDNRPTDAVAAGSFVQAARREPSLLPQAAGRSSGTTIALPPITELADNSKQPSPSTTLGQTWGPSASVRGFYDDGYSTAGVANAPTPAEPPTPSLLARNDLAKELPAKPAIVAGNALGGAEADQMSRRFYRLTPGGGGGTGGTPAPALKSEISDLPSSPAVAATTPSASPSPTKAADDFFTTGTLRDDVAALRQLTPGQPAATPEVAKSENLVPLEINLPQPAFKGTPRNVPVAVPPELARREKLAELDKNALSWGAYDASTRARQINPTESESAGVSVAASPPPIDPATGLPEPLAAPTAEGTPAQQTAKDQLAIRTFKVDPENFRKGLESVGGFAFNDADKKQSASPDETKVNQSGLPIPHYRVRQSDGLVAGGIAGQSGGLGGNQGVGVRFLTRTNSSDEVSGAARQYFGSLGVEPNKVFYNDREGTLLVRGKEQDLDIIELATKALDQKPPEVSIKAKFAEVAQADQKQKATDLDLYESLGRKPSLSLAERPTATVGYVEKPRKMESAKGPAGGAARGGSDANAAAPPAPGAVFLGYDERSSGGGAIASVNGVPAGGFPTIEAVPHWRLDGKDYYGEPPPGVTLSKDKAAFLGDMPLVGRLFRPEPNFAGGGVVAGKPATDTDSEVKLQLADGLNQNLALNKSTGGTLALDGANEFSGRATAVNSFVNDGTVTTRGGEADKLSTLSGNVDPSGKWNFGTGNSGLSTSGMITNASGAGDEGKLNVYSLKIVGYANVATNEGFHAFSQPLSLEEKRAKEAKPNGHVATFGVSDDRQLKDVVEDRFRKRSGRNQQEIALPSTGTATAPEALRRQARVVTDEELAKRAGGTAVEQQVAQAKGTIPDRELLTRLPSATEDKPKAATTVRDAAQLYELGRLDEASAKLKDAIAMDPANQQAYYYKNLVGEAKYLEAQNKRDVTSRQSLKEVEQAWAEPPNRKLTPLPRSYARSTIASTEKGRQSVAHKLDVIHLDSLNAEGLPLSEVINNLHDESKKRDPDKKGLNFILSGGLDASDLTNSAQVVLDPATGVPTAAAPPSHDLGATAVNIGPPLKDVRLADALDIIVKTAKKPIKYSIEEYGIVFSPAAPTTNSVAKEPEPPKQSRPKAPTAEPQPEVQTCDNAFSTFSLNISDVSFKLALASLEKGQMPDAASVRSEEFINAFDYRDPDPPPGAPIGYAFERARYPFAQNRDLVRFSLKTAALGRQAGRPLNLVLLLDNSGSMERADRVRIIHEALRVLAGQLQPQDKLSVITFARTARLVADGVSGSEASKVVEEVSGLTPEGGTNLEEAMNTAYATALRHYLADGINRVVLLTDGAANLGNVEPDALKQKVEAHRKQGVALDCFGIGWEGFNDDLLEVLSRNGDGRYGFINSPEEAVTEFAGQLAGALHVAASDVKVQVEFNPKRVVAYRQIGYAKHQLTKQQFRDNTVDAAEIAAQEAGNALYVVEVNPRGEGPLGTVRVRYKVPGTSEYHEHEWEAPYSGNAVELEQASPAMRLAATASAFSEWLVSSPFAGEVAPDSLLGYLSGVPEVYGADVRPKKLEWAIRQAKSLVGK